VRRNIEVHCLWRKPFDLISNAIPDRLTSRGIEISSHEIRVLRWGTGRVVRSALEGELIFAGLRRIHADTLAGRRVEALRVVRCVDELMRRQRSRWVLPYINAHQVTRGRILVLTNPPGSRYPSPSVYIASPGDV